MFPTAGPDEKYYYSHQRPYKNIQNWKVAGMIQDASFLINLAHAKGHPSCSFGAAFKNLALGCMIGETRGAMHDAMHFDQYWWADRCPDAATRQRIVEVCPHDGIVIDRDKPEELHLHFEQCNQCGRCLQVAPPGSLKIDPVNFHTFQEACAIAVDLVLSTFEKAKAVHLNLATHMTPVCDCFGFTSMPILAAIPTVAAGKHAKSGSFVIANSEPESVAAEQYRVLAMKVQQHCATNRANVILLTSAAGSEDAARTRPSGERATTVSTPWMFLISLTRASIPSPFQNQADQFLSWFRFTWKSSTPTRAGIP